MAFGQQSGPPASARQVQQLVALLHAAGHADLKDARGALGLTQRQAGGKFTRDEVEALIAQLEGEAETGEAAPVVSAPRPYDRREAEQAAALAKVPAPLLAAELQRRGWIVMEP